MEIELIPDTGVYEKDAKKFKMVRKENGENHYYVTLINKGGRCPCCGTYTTKCKELKTRKIIHDEKRIIHYSARRLKCQCGKTFYEDDPFTEDEINAMSAAQKAEYLRQKKEVRYEKGMQRLAKNLAKRKITTGTISSVASSAALISVFVPGIGTIVSCIGLGLTLASGLTGSKLMSKTRKKMFDDYFLFDDFYEKVLLKMQENGQTVYDKEKFKTQLRKRLAAAAGYANMSSACDGIARKYADLIRFKLFGEGGFEDENEKKGYIQMVKSLGLPYDEIKQKPDRYMLIKKLTGR